MAGSEAIEAGGDTTYFERSASFDPRRRKVDIPQAVTSDAVPAMAARRNGPDDMPIRYQTPARAHPDLVEAIAKHAGGADGGGAAFAFATRDGIQMLLAEPRVAAFLGRSDFELIVGLDAITDNRAVEALQDAARRHPRLTVRLFLHGQAGACFHPKVCWFSKNGKVRAVTGSGNLTAGGLRRNWEAYAIEKLKDDEAAAVVQDWRDWITENATYLKALDDAEAVERARLNGLARSRMRRAAAGTNGSDNDDALAEVQTEFRLNPVLIAEVPRSGDRWKQVNFDVHTYQQFFGVTLGTVKDVVFYHVADDGTVGEPEHRQSVAVASQNYRFEVGAAAGLPYPGAGHPILIFEKIADAVFRYMLLMPGEAAHTRVQTFLNNNYAATSRKRRVVITKGDLESAWPNCPIIG